MFEYCRQTGIDPSHVFRDWIHVVLQASTDWLKRKSDDIKKYMKKNPSVSLAEAFARDRELLRARELTEAVSERMAMHKHLARKHQLLLYTHREFARTLPPHIYVDRFEQSVSFQRTILGYDWHQEDEDVSEEEFANLIEEKADFVQMVLFGKTTDWLAILPPYYKRSGVGYITSMKMKALARAFQWEVPDRGDAAKVRAFDAKYTEPMRRMLTEIQDDFAEQMRLKRVRHYLGVELEQEANHVAHMINKLHGQYASSMMDRSEDAPDDFLTQINELNEKLPPMRPEFVPSLPANEDQAAVIVRGSFERQAPDIHIAKNRRVTYGGREWQVADFNHDTGDVILQRPEERTVNPSQVYLFDKPPSLNETYRIRTETGQVDDGWIYRGKDETGHLRMFKPNAERIEVPKLALISVNQLLANARAAATDSAAQLPLIQAMQMNDSGVMDQVLGIQQMSWSGSQLGTYMIEELLSDRKFYWIYGGNDQTTFEKKVFKVAKPIEYLRDLDVIDPLKSSVLKLSSAGFSTVMPNVSELLRLQCERMSYDTAHIMAKIEDVICTDALCYARMEFIEGLTLRELRKHGPLSLDVALDIVNALDTIQKNQGLHYHGDLTPDNIMISYSSVRLLDAGYFGALDCMEGVVEDAAITTPAYYPFLTPNDMLALGIIFWELHFGKNPFASFDETPAPTTGVSQTLLRVLKGYSSIGRPFVNSMARLPFPHTIEPSINPELAKFLLASLGLRINEQNELDAAPRFESFAQIADALNHLSEHGITEL
jgi:serine/threonine protein kinase